MHQGRQSIWTTRKNGHSIATSPRSLSRECTAQCTVLCKHCRYQFEKTQHRASSVGGPFIGDSGRKVMLAEFYARRSVVRRQQTAIDKRRCVKFVTNLGKCLEYQRPGYCLIQFKRNWLLVRWVCISNFRVQIRNRCYRCVFCVLLVGREHWLITINI